MTVQELVKAIAQALMEGKISKDSEVLSSDLCTIKQIDFVSMGEDAAVVLGDVEDDFFTDTTLTVN